MPPDFSGQNLRGRSFKGQDLSGANFSGADIRGANFTGAILKDANFSHAKAGLQRRWVIFLVMLSFLLLFVSGFGSTFFGVMVVPIFNGSMISPENPIESIATGWAFLIMMIIFCVVTIRQGIVAAFGALCGAFVIAIALALVGAGFGVGGSLVVGGGFTGILAVVFGIAGALSVAVAVAVGGAFAFAFAFALALVVAFVGALAGGFAGASDAVASAGFLAIVVSVAFTLCATYIGWRAIKGDEKQALIRNIAVVFAATGGTSFRGANLTDADFTGAILKNTDLRKAILIRTCWRDTKKLDLVRPGNTYLKNSQIRQLLLTGQGQDKNFDNLPLRGVNLQGANLADTSFTGADLSEANLQDVDLSRAKLKQTQLDATDFTGATLTGSYIEDWGITSHTNFTGVRCEYVYMRFPTKYKPDPLRKPDNHAEVFADGEFGDFIQPIFDTLDLYHNQGVDPRAIAIAVKELAENNPDAELEIVAMEKRGRDKFLIRAKTAPEINKSQLSAEYFEKYNHLKGLSPEEQINHFLSELKVKDNQINYQRIQLFSYENMISTAIGRPIIQAGTYNHLPGSQFGGGLVNADKVEARHIGGNITSNGQGKKHISCTNCGYENLANNKFCTQCGKSF